jgi:hypothetical protein
MLSIKYIFILKTCFTDNTFSLKTFFIKNIPLSLYDSNPLNNYCKYGNNRCLYQFYPLSQLCQYDSYSLFVRYN